LLRKSTRFNDEKNVDSQKKETLDQKYMTDLSDYKKIGVVLRSNRVFRTLYVY